MPFSREGFQKYFGEKIQNQKPSKVSKICLELSVIELETVFGRNWYILRTYKSTTQQRILGMVSINFKPKFYADKKRYR